MDRGGVRTVWWEPGAVCLIDQTKLPHTRESVRCGSVEAVADAIRAMVVRGAPAIGPLTLITDNMAAHFMGRGEVDCIIVGADRIVANGDVANKIGTYLKALAARDNGVPFWVAMPHSTLDAGVADGVAGIPIEERAAEEVTEFTGRTADGRLETVRVAAEGSPAANPAFDVTPARLVTGLITERGRCEASEAGLLALYPEKG
jgi:methylthioribose-1-phosphate isomerase